MRATAPLVSYSGGLLLLISCSGDGKGADAPGDSTALTDEQPVVIDCSERPPYNLETLDCSQLGNAFHRTVDALDACNTAEDCLLVRPQCENWNAVGCFYAANTCMDQGVVQEFNSNATGCSSPNESCTCGGAPEVDCVNHTCVIVD